MSWRKLYEHKSQIDYFSDEYTRFEEDFPNYSDVCFADILSILSINPNNYFKLNKENPSMAEIINCILKWRKKNNTLFYILNIRKINFKNDSNENIEIIVIKHMV